VWSIPERCRKPHGICSQLHTFVLEQSISGFLMEAFSGRMTSRRTRQNIFWWLMQQWKCFSSSLVIPCSREICRGIRESILTRKNTRSDTRHNQQSVSGHVHGCKLLQYSACCVSNCKSFHLRAKTQRQHTGRARKSTSTWNDLCKAAVGCCGVPN